MNKPKIMCILGQYPQISETYVQTEIDAVSAEYEMVVISLNDIDRGNKPGGGPGQPPQLTSYREHNPFLAVNKFDHLCNAVKMFRPGVIHSHWLIHLPLLHRLAMETGTPYTVRAHSFDAIPSGNPVSHS
ncbi:MAG: hypothetical protein OQK94_07740 [Gammaproteobacteria bacterium]|nr:hypothetical protein [Gammaproteobacteria bacterium]MCW8840765.1 hypothetical protein [Gammaproteobacteria bacterium]MCW8958744.1 hypothetical protein [Gammaproteobacteria bacterium]MCW8973623.1 hypothetical protein [Gammaproteobacteria bacterium]MCW8993755.1 hypothetical protein [Gammaproteobacteria bacterium]